MINLLPDTDKREIRAGRANHLLVRYTAIMAVVVIVMVVEFVLAYFYMQHIKDSAQSTITDNQTRGQEIKKKEQEISEFRGNLATSKQILDKQVDYSAITLEISSLIPRGVVLEQLAINPASFGTTTAITARTTNESTARNLKSSLEKSAYFSDVKFNTITRSQSGDTAYPYTAILSVTFNKELLNK